MIDAIGQGLRQAQARAPVGRGGRSRSVTTLTAIEHGHVCQLKQTLAGFPSDDGSPLARLEDVHFGRWVVIDRLRTDWPGAPRRRPVLKSAYLLFDATVTTPADGGHDFPAPFFAEICARLPQAADAVWRHCVGYPGAGDRRAFVEYLMAARLRTGVHRFGYPGATVADVKRALDVRDEFARFALDHQDASAEDLRDAYLEAAARWLG